MVFQGLIQRCNHKEIKGWIQGWIRERWGDAGVEPGWVQGQIKGRIQS